MAYMQNAFAIFGSDRPAELDAKVPKAFTDSYQVAPGAWVVASPVSLTAEVYKTLGGGADITCVIVPMTRFYGYYNKGLWEWIEQKTNGK